MDWKEIIGAAVGSSTVTAGIFMLLSRVVPTPQHRANLIKLGNEFTEDLLKQARLEREELRASIRLLEQANIKSQLHIGQLKLLIAEKDRVIVELQSHQKKVAHKVSMGLEVTNADIFGIILNPES
jgi:hypothetical protein